MAKNKIAKPEKQKQQIDPKEALAILNKEAQDKERRVSIEIERILQREGFRLDIQHKIVLVPIR